VRTRRRANARDCQNAQVFTVRAATSEDAAGVANVHVRAWKAAYRGLLPDEYLDDLRPEHRIAHYTLGSSDPDVPATLVAVVDGVVRGFVTTGPCRDPDETDRGEVLALHVDPGSWGLGIGRRLLSEGRAALSARGFAEAVLWVLAGNSRAERFYRSDGWLSEDRRRTHEVWGVVIEESRFRRPLP
jgi:ribosomal protein S18 acetylase RimI-like enzyme